MPRRPRTTKPPELSAVAATPSAAGATQALAALEARATALRERILEADYAYYTLANPIIADADYDALMRELRALELAHPALVTPESPTQRVSGESASTFAKVRHLTPMLSLANVRSPDELRAWQQRAQHILPDVPFRYVCEPKIDGLSMNLTYEHGRLTRGATRGDGVVGEDVTANVRTIHDIPRQMRHADSIPVPARIEVRGEIFMRHDDFQRLNAQLAAEAQQSNKVPRLFANARNAAAGSLRQKDPHVTAQRPLSFIAYYIGGVVGAAEPESQWQTLAWLRAWGFPVSDLVAHVDTLEEAQAYCHDLEQRRFSIPFDIDGAVVKVDDRWQQQELGEVARDPRWAIAYKFVPVEAYSRLRDIVVTVGRTGALTPNARLDPVQIGGVVVSRAQLFNADEIERKDLRIGDTVVVQRHGDVIPGIVKSLIELRTGDEQPWVFPTQCPVCHAPVFREDGEAVTYCTNVDCPAQRLERLIHWAGRAAMDIRGLGEATAARLIEHGLVRDGADLYHLSTADLRTLPGFQQRSAENLHHAIVASIERPFPRVLFALGIRHVGEKAALTLAEGVGSMEALLAAAPDTVAALPGIGPTIAESVSHWAQLETNRAMVARLRESGLRLAQPAPAPDAAGVAAPPLAGQSFLLTGSLAQLTRGQAEEALQSLGGRIASSVGKALSHLIVGAAPGSKLARAEKLGVPTHDEAWLVDLLRAHGVMPAERKRMGTTRATAES